MLEVLITKRSSTKWEWRLCDRYGATIIGGFRAPDQRPITGAIGRYFLCCLRAGYGDARSRAPECEQRSCKVPLQPFLSATFSTADIYRTVRHICFVPILLQKSPVTDDVVWPFHLGRRGLVPDPALSTQLLRYAIHRA